MKRGSFARFGYVARGSFASALATILICTLFPFGSAARAQTQADAASGSPKNFFAWLTECPLLASDKDPQPAPKPDEAIQLDPGILAASSDGGGVAGTPAGNNPDPATPPDAGSDTASPAGGDTLLSHPKSDRFWISGQYNLIAQWHPGFHAQYSGPHSFGPNSGQSISSVVTLFTGFRLDDTTELVVDPESATSTTPGQGFAGYPNLDIAGGPPLSAEPYLARLWLRKVIPLSEDQVKVDPSPVSMITSLPVRRLEFHVGKLAMADFFDLNSVGSDTHMQFINWTVNNNGAWDYPADPRGYTYAAIIEYFDHDWAARFGEALEPNGSNLE